MTKTLFVSSIQLITRKEIFSLIPIILYAFNINKLDILGTLVNVSSAMPAVASGETAETCARTDAETR